ncbi:MAG: trypsin-like peptidase domain-containing protein [Clostridia bacterium]|nr:trypsin-like peptidase domain-containing protein [Clostridia bacterium]
MKIVKKISACIAAFALVLSVAACNLFKSNTDGPVVNAYDIAVQNGFKGTEKEWLESLRGKDGDNANTVYKSLYEEAKENYGYEGSFYDFVAEYMSGYAQASVNKSVDIAADKAVKSAVSVYSTFSRTVTVYDFRGNRTTREETYTGAGSGVIIDLDENGNAYIVTNFHVIYDVNDSDGYANEIKVYVYGREISSLAVDAKLVGATATYDLAVLKVTDSEIFRTSNLAAAEFRADGIVSAGEEIFAVGNPEASGLAVTSGIVSVDSEYIQMTSPKDGKTKIEYRVIRIDAAVNGGNSGGGLFDLDGNLTGIVNAKIVSDEIDNIAYAIPSAIVKNVTENIIANCNGTDKLTIGRYVVGVTIAIKNSYAYYDAILNDTRIVQEVEISSVTSGSSADGVLKAGDILKSFEYNGKVYKVDRLFSLTDVNALLYERGKTIKFTVERDGEEKTVSITLTNYSNLD